MSAAPVLACLAGVVCAAAVGELWRGMGPRRGRRRATASGLLRALAAVGRRTGAPDGRAALLLEAAGDPGRITPADLAALRVGSALVAAALALVLTAPLAPRLSLALVLAGPLAGFAAPDWWLARRARARGRAMDRELADVAALLAIALDTGLPLQRALAEAAGRGSGPLAAEMARCARAIVLGVPRDDALHALRRRCPSSRAAALVVVLARGARHGQPPGEALAALAADARDAQARALAERAARAVPQIQLVVALGLVPAVLALVAAVLLAGLAPGS